MNFKIMTGDNRDTLKTLEDNSVDAIVTDPPYGIDFLGKDWDANTGAIETYQECLRVLKPGGHILAFSAARTYHHLAITLEQAGFEIRDQIMWIYGSGFPKAQDIGKAIQKRQGVEKTEHVDGGARPSERMDGGLAKGRGHDDRNSAGYTNIIPTSPEAQQWAGWKTALKPAHEPICMARKPMKGSTIDCVLQWGTGALNIDANRIGDESLEYNNTIYNDDGSMGWPDTFDKEKRTGKNMVKVEGRFPSNVIGEIPDYQKYFYCPKVSRRERHCGFEDPGALFNGPRIESLANDPSNKMKNAEKGTGNNHPTVKPVELMKYLIKLVTPPNATVLDPFTGSGSTGMAAVELGHTFIGCEMDPNYVAIAETRIRAWNTPEEPGNNYGELFE